MANADVSDAGWESALDRMGLKLMLYSGKRQ
jgi:hypothetical protein